MRQKFFKHSAEKFYSRIDPGSEANRDLRVIFPEACSGVNTSLFLETNSQTASHSISLSAFRRWLFRSFRSNTSGCQA
jgi:hypothetical protein